MKKTLVKTLFLAIVAATPLQISSSTFKELMDNSFRHLDLAVNVGTTGIGFEASTPIGDYVKLRAGFDFMPKFTYDMQFTIQIGDSIESKYDKNGNRIETKFDKMAGLLEEFTGTKVDDTIDMVGEPKFNNFKLIVDVYPFKDKRWYFSAGFYLGSSQIGYAYNTTEDMPSLMAVSIYNNIYQKVVDGDAIFMDLELPPDINKTIKKYGRMGMHVGDNPEEGTPYIMVPDENNMVKAYMHVNAFRPYLGAGYSGRISKDGRLRVSANLGVLFWGGSPKVYTHDGTEIVNGLTNVPGQVGRYTDLARGFKVFPVLNASISYRLF